MVSGVSAATLRNACESVTTKGGWFFKNVPALRAIPFLYNTAIGVAIEQIAMVCTCGRMSLPFALPCRWAPRARRTRREARDRR